MPCPPCFSPRRAAVVLASMVGASSIALSQPVPAAAPASAAAAAPLPPTAQAGEQPEPQAQQILVKGTAVRESEYAAGSSSGATGLDLSLRETPQSISVIKRTLMDDFGLTSVNRALGMATGIVVERTETDRTYYTARGFDITNFQTDGIGIPFAFGIFDGDIDTAAYERIEVIRGANGLMSNIGNPSATINFVRKRPTAAFQASAAYTLGSWNDHRIDLDVAGPLTAGGGVRGRFVAAGQDRDSYLDRYHSRKGLLYGVIEADLGERTTLTFGHTQQNNRPTGVMWGALPLYYTDGTRTDYDRSSSTTADWTYWHTDTGVTFAEVTHAFDGGWQLTGVLTHKEVDSPGKLFYVYGVPNRETGEGLFAYPSYYTQRNREDIVDVRATGPVELGGRKHDLVIGASASRSKMKARSLHGDTVGDPVPEPEGWDGNFPEPNFNVDGNYAEFTDKQRNLYAAAHISATERLKFIVGANYTSIDNEGVSYSAPRKKSESETTPYFGVVYDLTPTLSLYASRAAIFNPQSEQSEPGVRLDPAKGMNLEGGLKAEWFDGQLMGTLALFKAEQENLATLVGTNNQGFSEYRGVDTRSRGFEVELTGAVTPRWQVTTGYTQLEIKGEDSNDARTFSPRRVLRLSTTYRVPGVDPLKIGGTLDARSRTYTAADGNVIRQPGYALLGLMANWEFNDNWSLTLNVDNVTDVKYLTSLYWTQGYYGEPRSVEATLRWTY